MMEVVAGQKQIAAQAAFDEAKSYCGAIAGFTNGADAAVALNVKREADEYERNILKIVDKQRLDAIRVGGPDFKCAILIKSDGTPLASGVRPACNEGLCCGSSNNGKSGDDLEVVETCQKPETVTVTVRPKRDKLSIVDVPVEQWGNFSCIEGAQALVA